MTAQIREALNIDVTVKDIFASPSFKRISEVIEVKHIVYKAKLQEQEADIKSEGVL